MVLWSAAGQLASIFENGKLHADVLGVVEEIAHGAVRGEDGENHCRD